MSQQVRAVGDTSAITVNIGAPGGAEDVPVLREGDALDLPEGAVENADGTVTLTLQFPVTLAFRTAAAAVVVSEVISTLLLSRLKGADMRRALAAAPAKTTMMILARSVGMTDAKLALFNANADATDITAATEVVQALLEMGEGLPARATRNDDGSVTLVLREPTDDGDDATHTELLFKRLTGGDLSAIAASKDRMPFAMHRAIGITLKAAQGLFDELDGADVIAATRVVGFLSGEWPDEWPLIIAAIGAHYHWPRSELEGLTAESARFWHNAAAGFLQKVREQSGGR